MENGGDLGVNQCGVNDCKQGVERTVARELKKKKKIRVE
ncbi:hypothetical protein Tco_0479819, partial [Tanacetum coccineum]